MRPTTVKPLASASSGERSQELVVLAQRPERQVGDLVQPRRAWDGLEIEDDLAARALGDPRRVGADAVAQVDHRVRHAAERLAFFETNWRTPMRTHELVEALEPMLEDVARRPSRPGAR